MHLTGKEYGLLELLSLRKGTTSTKKMVLNHLYGGVQEPALKIIDVFVCKLRKKLAHATGGNHYIETIWGRGYVLCDPESTPAVSLSPRTARRGTKLPAPHDARPTGSKHTRCIVDQPKIAPATIAPATKSLLSSSCWHRPRQSRHLPPKPPHRQNPIIVNRQPGGPRVPPGRLSDAGPLSPRE